MSFGLAKALVVVELCIRPGNTDTRQLAAHVSLWERLRVHPFDCMYIAPLATLPPPRRLYRLLF